MRRSGSGMPTIRSSSSARAAGRLVLHVAVDLQDLADLVAHVHDRVQRRGRLLEDHRDAVAAQLAQLLVRHRAQLLAVEQDLAALDAAGLRDQAKDREAGHALAAARLADEAHDLAAVDREVHAGHGAHDAIARVERGPQAAHIEDGARRAALHPERDRRARAGRSPRSWRRRGRRSPVEPRIQRVPDAVAEQVEAEHGQGQREAGEEQQVRRR